MADKHFKIERGEFFNQSLASLKCQIDNVDLLISDIEKQLREQAEDVGKLKILKRTGEYSYEDCNSKALFLLGCYVSQKNSLITLDSIDIVTEKKSNFSFTLSIISICVAFILLFWGNSFGNLESLNWLFFIYVPSGIVNIYYNFKYCRLVRTPERTSELDKLKDFLKNVRGRKVNYSLLAIIQSFYAFLQLIFVINLKTDNIISLIFLLFSLYFFIHSFGNTLGLSFTSISFLFCLFLSIGLLSPEMWLGISLIFTLFSNIFSEDIWKLTEHEEHPLALNYNSKYNRYQVDKKLFRLKIKLSVYAIIVYIFLYLTKDIKLYGYFLMSKEVNKGILDSIFVLLVKGSDRIILVVILLLVFLIIKYITERNGWLSLEGLKKEYVEKIYDDLYSEIRGFEPKVKPELSCYYEELTKISPELVIENLVSLPEKSMLTWLTDMNKIKETAGDIEYIDVYFVIRYPSGKYNTCKTKLKILKLEFDEDLK